MSPEIDYRYIMVDETWTWTKGFSNLIECIGAGGLFHNVGPILWYLPVNSKSKEKKDCINISIFDVMPKRQKSLDRLGMSNMYIYYSFENMSRFIQDIVDLVAVLNKSNNQNIRVLLKYKREINNNTHDMRYIDFFKSLSKSVEFFSLINPNINLYSLIGDSAVTISTPYTSTAYVSDYLNIPAIFYDSSSGLIPAYEETKNITFASGKKDLEKQLNYLLK
jgi:polysaccharide biosynthesis PFTS motif protein